MGSCGLNLPCSQAATENQQAVFTISNDSKDISGSGESTSAGSGVHGVAHAPWAAGVVGTNLRGEGVGVSGIGAIGVQGTGEFGQTGEQDQSGIGVQGSVESGIGVRGSAQSGVGVHGEAVGEGGVGVVGWHYKGTAGFFYGAVDVFGILTKSGGGFKIDHPADPANKYLSHSFVESPDRKNVYDGVVVLNARGEAKVTLPSWFEGLNRDFRYQLTAMGSPGPDLHIAQGISKNAFRIAGGKSRMKVSWQVTGIRKDRWAASNPVQVEEKKPVRERGHYRHPEVHGHPKEKSILWARHPDLMRQMKAAKPRPKKGGSKKPV